MKEEVKFYMCCILLAVIYFVVIPEMQESLSEYMSWVRNEYRQGR